MGIGGDANLLIWGEGKGEVWVVMLGWMEGYILSFVVKYTLC